MKVFITKKIPEIGMKMLGEAGMEIILPDNNDLTRYEWLEHCRNADAVLNVGSRFRYDRAFFDPLPGCEGDCALLCRV
ncbi:hypothetical protein QE441_002618 [Chryseobacterium sp. SORGH_AS909]|uniref:hypothetical protein n=1 Tax=Chryseobacterium sp. SORGH_AS_0909 TaxID=3041759 RepID=UPI002866DC32|nr:hypothetical protein [Chryseobacterium sp. SORGH_AS_0909]MDR6086824.1 hypothetical protein [Chryseobacterium sp. SORGH_AS_0909]